jgi:hypothetical protein
MEELFKKYPKAAEKAVDYYTEIFKKSIEESDVDEKYKEYARETVRVDDEHIAKMVELNPRGSFDVFDANEIYINVTAFSNGSFIYSILGDTPEVGSTETSNTRKEAEAAAVQRAFEILNNKL